MRKRRKFCLHRFLLLLFVGVLIYICLNENLNIGNFVVHNNKNVPTEEILMIAKVNPQGNVLAYSPGRIQDHLRNDFRISEVKVYRSFPANIEIYINERQPIAYIPTPQGFASVDRDGFVLDIIYSFTKKIELPIISGYQFENVSIGDKITENNLDQILEYISNLSVELSEVHVDIANEKVSAYPLSTTLIQLGPLNQIANKAAITNQLINDLKVKGVTPKIIDLSYETPYIKL